MEVKQEDEKTSSGDVIENQAVSVSSEILTYSFSKLDVEGKINDIVDPKAAYEIIQQSNSYEEQNSLDTDTLSETKKNRRSKRRSRSSISEEDDGNVSSEFPKGKDVRYMPYALEHSTSQGKPRTDNIKHVKDETASANADLTQLISSLSPSKQGFVQADKGDCKNVCVSAEALTSTTERVEGTESQRVVSDVQPIMKKKDNGKKKGKPASRDDRSGGSYSKLLASMGRPSSEQINQSSDGQAEDSSSFRTEVGEEKNQSHSSLPTTRQKHSLPVSELESASTQGRGPKQTSHVEKDVQKAEGRQPVKKSQTYKEDSYQFPETSRKVQSAKSEGEKSYKQKQSRQALPRDQYEGYDSRRKGNRDQRQRHAERQHTHYQDQKYGVEKQNVQRQGSGQEMSRAPGDQGRQQTKKRQKSKMENKQKQVFDPYWPVEAVTDGLKRKELIQGQVRINPKNFNEAYVPLPDGSADVFICGVNNRNRALNGDVVAIQILNREQWRVFKEDLDLFKSESRDSPNPDIQKVSTVTKTTLDQSEGDVIIESEEEVEMDEQGAVIKRVKIKITEHKVASQQIQSTAEASNSSSIKNASEKQDTSTKGTPQKKYTSLGEILMEDNPTVKQLFAEKMDSSAMYKQVSGNRFLQMTGKVVYIIEKKHSRACTGFLKPMQDGNKERAFFSPLDYRLPRIIIPVSVCPKGFLERPGDCATTLFVARIVDWKESSIYAEGCLAKSLGEAGQIEPETEGILIENDVAFEEFPQEAIENLPKEMPWTIPPKEFEYRRDFRSQCVFTIDPTTARDLDDALSCEDLGSGEYEIGVHIADVSFFLEENCLLDRIAGSRATSVYLVQKVIPMLPRILCEQLCSLNPAEERLTFSVVWKVNEVGEISEEWFGRSVIKSCVKLSYDHAQGFIDQPDKDWNTEELPSICGDFSIQDIKSRVLVLNKIAQHLRKARFDSGALRLDQVKLQYSLDPDSGLPNGYYVYSQRDSNKLVEEFMLLANMAVAHKINAVYPETALLRRHPEPQSKMAEDLRSLLKSLGVDIDISSAGSIQESLESCYGEDDYSKARLQVLTTLCSKPMQNAKYFCVGCIDDEELYRHYALNVPLYTHFTSPIRRYADVIVHRLLASSLNYCAVTSRSKMDIQKQASHCNDKKTAAKRVQDLSSELFFAVFVKEVGPLEESGMVMGVLNKAFDVYILKLGVSKRVYCDQLPLKDILFRKDHKQPILTLYWSTDENHPTEVEQEITIFSLVKCVLKADKEPLKWQATIKHPN